MDQAADYQYRNATVSALEHAATRLKVPITVQVVATDSIGDAATFIGRQSAVVIGPGSPYRDANCVLAVITEARERGLPLVGT